MPKVPTTPSRAAQKSATAQSLPELQKGAASAAKKPHFEPKDESNWRKSRIPINSKAHQRRTALAETWGHHSTDLALTDGFPSTEAGFKAFLYREQDVERLAWRKYGGPEEFAAMLGDCEKKYKKRWPSKQFPQPAAYNPSSARGWVDALTLPPSYYTTLASVEDRVKSKLVQKAHGDEWLWHACLKAWRRTLSTYEDYIPIPGQTHLHYCEAACNVLPTYPPRINPPQPLPPSFQNLQGVLDEAPDFRPMEEDYITHPAIEQCDDHVDGWTWYEWTTQYLERVFHALITIIKHHGVGPTGWKAARWMVYDAHSRSLGGITSKLVRGDWVPDSDEAFHWLEGQGKESYFSIPNLVYRYPAKFKEYYALLPTSDCQ
ncbi:hypothetical protein FA15DRAFT_737461 [Coprinopsis marcescibilis]|uniref:Uncharacterized protein n=1 Tax=Coprinopsis marcescibilis TaxID=230819 RepID=A0A5C3KXR7_COPMA|nr:hypothetical protein FA15DRAFT_737461 [Coprinopsis marcescibilis]